MQAAIEIGIGTWLPQGLRKLLGGPPAITDGCLRTQHLAAIPGPNHGHASPLLTRQAGLIGIQAIVQGQMSHLIDAGLTMPIDHGHAQTLRHRFNGGDPATSAIGNTRMKQLASIAKCLDQLRPTSQTVEGRAGLLQHGAEWPTALQQRQGPAASDQNRSLRYFTGFLELQPACRPP